MTIFQDAAVQAVFAAYPLPAQRRLLALRDMVFEVAGASPEIGPLRESLKWGEPAYRRVRAGFGTTLRVHWKPVLGDCVALYVPCTTSLMEDFRARWPDAFAYQGHRAILLPQAGRWQKAALRQAIQAVFLYRRRNKMGT